MVFDSMKRIDTGSGVPTQTPYRKSFGFAESFIGGSARTGTPRPSFCFLRYEKAEGTVVLTYVKRSRWSKW